MMKCLKIYLKTSASESKAKISIAKEAQKKYKQSRKHQEIQVFAKSVKISAFCLSLAWFAIYLL